jgi:hypothetical protein
MVKNILIFFVVMLSITSNKSQAQYYFYDNKYYDNPVLFEVGASIGGMNCFTDLGGKQGVGKKFLKDYNFKNTQLCGSIYFNVMYKYEFCFRLEGTFGQVKAYDSILKKVGPSTFGRYERNLSFRSPIMELMAAVEIHPLFIFGNYNEDWRPPSISPYILAGIGFFKFNPQAKLNNVWVDLQPLHTEGQGFANYPERKEYKLNQVNFPLGIGLKYELSSLFNIRTELVYRILQTDYLDDVSTTYIDQSEFSNYLSGIKLNQALLLNKRSTNTTVWKTDPGSQRGNPKTNDAYFSFNLKIGLIIGRERIKK